MGHAPAINGALAERKLASPSGYRFELRAYKHGLYMRRCSPGQDQSSVEHSINFEDEDAFAAWMASDKIAFDDPLLYNELKRCASELFAIRRSAAADA